MHYIENKRQNQNRQKSKYVSYKELLSEISSSKMNEANPAVDGVQKLILSSASESDYSIQEVVHILMKWSMFHTSPDEATMRRHDKDLKEINFASDERQSKTLSRNTARDRRDFFPFLA